MRKLHIGAAAVSGALAALLSFPALAGAHAVVSPFQPQATPLTAARTLYVLRVPNEKPTQPTFKVVLSVPAAVQEEISVRQVSDWRVRLSRRDTGKKDDEGNTVYAVTAITWTAKRGAQIDPGFFGEFYFRFTNPTTAQQLCFPVLQAYRAAGSSNRSRRGRRRPARRSEIVRWTGPPDAEFPASCVSVAAAPA